MSSSVLFPQSHLLLGMHVSVFVLNASPFGHLKLQHLHNMLIQKIVKFTLIGSVSNILMFYRIYKTCKLCNRLVIYGYRQSVNIRSNNIKKKSLPKNTRFFTGWIWVYLRLFRFDGFFRFFLRLGDLLIYYLFFNQFNQLYLLKSHFMNLFRWVFSTSF